jgi:hypothetical protein
MFSQDGDHLVRGDAGLERGRNATSPHRGLDRVDRKDRGTESSAKCIRQLALPYRRQAAHRYQHLLIMPGTEACPGRPETQIARTPTCRYVALGGAHPVSFGAYVRCERIGSDGRGSPRCRAVPPRASEP